MGKSGGKKKKGVSNHVSGEAPAAKANGAHELKEEGNKRFQGKDYGGALEQYHNALNLLPKTHPERAVFHSNRAACLMQMKPMDYEAVIAECTMALQVQPRFVRALLRRARALEAIGRIEVAMQDVQVLLGSDPNNGDALEIARRLRMALGPRQEAQQDLQSRPSPAALGASAVRGAPVGGLGPSGTVLSASNKIDKPQLIGATENGPVPKAQMPKLVLKPLSCSSTDPLVTSSIYNKKEQSSSLSASTLPLSGWHSDLAVPLRPLKLIYDHDIRLAQMPVNCSFKVLRDIVSKRFPSSKSVLIKYRDNDGDLVNITCSSELRMAESSVDSVIEKEPEPEKADPIGLLRLHIVEVTAEQEPPLLAEDEEKPQPGTSEDPECKDVEMDDWLFESVIEAGDSVIARV
ncbi:hypothetical protein EUGRSUZ_D01375 [Eucalyptus grandis]|uniref:Uncharacterized protein n=2 Tax=Eucalyptus grandis TaxID=71139 RepID=A0ACC3L4U5_EUCGR|nr:hypothetical protein EUGRSUZ_D01375 [Eucalyptus grandis]